MYEMELGDTLDFPKGQYEIHKLRASCASIGRKRGIFIKVQLLEDGGVRVTRVESSPGGFPRKLANSTALEKLNVIMKTQEALYALVKEILVKLDTL